MSQRTLVFLFRYGAGEHVDFLPALPLLCRRLREKGWQVEHLGFRSSIAPPQELTEVCRVRELPFLVNRASRTDKVFKAIFWLLLLPWIGWRMQRRGVHTVFVDETLPLSAGALRWRYRGRLCFTVHDFFADIYLSDRWWTRSFGRWLKWRDAKDWVRLDQIFVRVQAAKDYLQTLGIAAERIQVVPDSVDTDVFAPGEAPELRAEWGVGSDEVVLIHHGILHPNKGNVRMVEALARSKDQVPELRTVLIGDGSEMPHLRRRLRELGMEDRVKLLGWLPGLPEIAQALRAADIGLVMRLGLPGDDFHVTSTLVHNLASGLPILSVRLKGLEESIQEHQQGLFFDASCGEEFEQMLVRLVKDRSLRQDMGQRSRQLALQRFSRGNIAGRYAAALGVDLSVPD